MTGEWYIARVKCERVMEDGLQKKVQEQYLVDAVNFGEAEARIIGELAPLNKEVKVVGLAKMNVTEVWPALQGGEKWYKIKASIVVYDEKAGKDNKNSLNYLIQSDSTAQAEKDYNERMRGTMTDYIVESVAETKIVDVYPYHPEEETEETR